MKFFLKDKYEGAERTVFGINGSKGIVQHSKRVETI